MVNLTKLIDRLRGQAGQAQSRLPRLILDARPAAIYAIGDVHGCLDQLLRLESRIIADGSAIDGEKWIISLGDHIDRGPNSAGVIEHLIKAAPSGFKRYTLIGNHEAMMLDFLASPSADNRWLDFGGMQTLASYGIHEPAKEAHGLQMQLHSHIPEEHIDFIRRMPAMISVDDLCFVHAGIRDDVPLDRQTDRDLLWLRPETEGDHRSGLSRPLVVHGHTPIDKLEVASGRINLDTGAFATGVLSAARFSGDGSIIFLQSD